MKTKRRCPTCKRAYRAPLTKEQKAAHVKRQQAYRIRLAQRDGQ